MGDILEELKLITRVYNNIRQVHPSFNELECYTICVEAFKQRMFGRFLSFFHFYPGIYLY